MTEKFDVINFHLTERCNYRCTYCFAKFNNEYELKIDEWKKAVDIVHNYFQRNDVKDVRINLAGGEPLIINYLEELIDYIHSLGIKVSIITNASLLTKERIDKWGGKVDLLGISIDSLNLETNLIIGRASCGQTIILEELIEVLNYAKSRGIKIKINTVVSKLNLGENLSSLYNQVSFDRIKLLQVRINDNCNESAKAYEITTKEFNEHCSKINIGQKMVIEPENELECSYIVVDTQGNLTTNKGNCHRKIGSIFEDTMEELIIRAEINHDTFLKRYQTEEGANK